MFALAPIDPQILVSEPPPAAPALGDIPVSQTPSLGLKQSVVRWVPGEPTEAGALALAGSWDEPANELSAWRVRLDDGNAMPMNADDDTADYYSPQLVGAAPHKGCVLGLSVAAGTGMGGAIALAYTASGCGGVACYSVRADEGGDTGAEVELRSVWQSAAPPGGLATLGVASGAGGDVAAVSEDGRVALLTAERGTEAWAAQSHEPALYAACWWDHNMLAVAGAVVSVWDVRVRGASPSLTLATTPGAHAHLGTPLLCLSTEPYSPHRLAAGGTDGSLAVWDVRVAKAAVDAGAAAAGAGGAGSAGGGAPPLQRFGAHTADVWDVQLVGSRNAPSGGACLLSCGTDGLLHSWPLEAPATALDASEPPARETLVQLALPVNSLELSPHGVLAAASDAQVLTFLDYA